MANDRWKNLQDCHCFHFHFSVSVKRNKQLIQQQLLHSTTAGLFISVVYFGGVDESLCLRICMFTVTFFIGSYDYECILETLHFVTNVLYTAFL